MLGGNCHYLETSPAAGGLSEEPGQMPDENESKQNRLPP
jgi:hypothetical protein